MFGIQLQPDEWAAVSAIGFLALRMLYAFVAVLWAYAAESALPRVGFGAVTSLASGGAAATLAVAGVSIARGGFPGAVGIVAYAFVAAMGFFLGIIFDHAVTLRALRLWVWLMAFRVPQYREQLQHPDTDRRLVAATKLFCLGRYALPAMPELLDALKDPSVEVRQAAALTVLHSLPDPPEGVGPEVAAAVRAVLADPDLMVRVLAAAILVRLGVAIPEQVVPVLSEGVRSSGECLFFATEALGRLGSAAGLAIPELRDAALATSEDNVLAATVLGKVGPAAVPALIEVLERGNPQCQYVAAHALGEMGETARPALPALRRLSLQTTNLASGMARQTIQKLGGTIQ